MSGRILVVGPPADVVTRADIAEAVALIGNRYLCVHDAAILGLLWTYAILLDQTDDTIKVASAIAPCDGRRESVEL